jgi:hypothetical protein
MLKRKLTLLAAALATIASALAVATIVGREVRLVELIAIFAGGFGTGASVTAAVMTIRSSRAGPPVAHPTSTSSSTRQAASSPEA